MLISILIGLVGTAVSLSLLCLALAIRLYITVEAIKASTHKVEYINPFQELDPSFEEEAIKNAEKMSKQSQELNQQLIREQSEFADYPDDFKSI